MSDHPREAERNLKRIHICDDVWYNVFDWTSRADLGLKIAPISPGFDALVGRHLKGIRRWTLGHIGFQQSMDNRAVVWNDGNVNSNGVLLLEESALLDVPPPSNLIGFRLIEIRYVDQSVITFLQRICHLFNTVDTNLMLLNIWNSDFWSLITTHLLPLIARRLYKLIHYNNLDNPLLFLRDCANLRVIHADLYFPEMPADDGAMASNSQAMAKWLHTSRSDGLPKVLKCGAVSFEIAPKLEGLKTTFVNAESPVSYIIYVRIFELNVGIEPFDFVNERTRERMTFEKTADQDEENVDVEYYLLKRGPILWGKSEWAESESRAKESVEDLSKEMNLIWCEEITTFDENI